MSALRELTQRRHLFYVLVDRQIRIRSKRSRLSIVWPVVSPLFLMLLYVFVFRRVFNVPIERYPEFLLCGLLPWAFLSQSLGRTISSVSSEPEIIRKSRFPYEYLPLSATGAHSINFLFTLALFIGYLGITGELHLATLPLVIFPVVAAILLAMSLSMLVALVDVYNQDLQILLPNGLLIWFFLLPVVYRPEMTPSSIGWLRSVDPMSLIVVQIRAVLFYGQIDEPGNFVKMLLLSLALFFVCLSVFRRFADELPKDV